MSTILKVEDINVYYGSIHAIKDISFEVNEGEIVTLIGANGAGKSSTLNTIAGLLRSKTGSIMFNGENISHTPAYKIVGKGIAMVPEGRRIFQQMTVRKTLTWELIPAVARSMQNLKLCIHSFRGLKSVRNRLQVLLAAVNSRCLPWEEH